MGRCRCGLSLGFLKKGLCADCQKTLDEARKGIALLRRLNPCWKHSPAVPDEDGHISDEYFSSNGLTPDGDKAIALISHTDPCALSVASTSA